jgi:hypothetical protein
VKASPDKVSDLEDAAYPSPKPRYLYQRFTAELVNLPEETTMNPASTSSLGREARPALLRVEILRRFGD